MRVVHRSSYSRGIIEAWRNDLAPYFPPEVLELLPEGPTLYAYGGWQAEFPITTAAGATKHEMIGCPLTQAYGDEIIAAPVPAWEMESMVEAYDHATLELACRSSMQYEGGPSNAS